SPRAEDYRRRLRDFLGTRVSPLSARPQEPELARLRSQARDAGLWNLFLPGERGAGLSNLEYAPLAEEMGRVPWSAEVFNCSAPDTGNMEVLLHSGTPAHRQRWLEPLLAGE